MPRARYAIPALVVLGIAALVVAAAIRETGDTDVIAELPPPPDCEPGAKDRNPENRRIEPRRGEPLLGREDGVMPFGFNDAAYQTGQLGLGQALDLYREAKATIWRMPLDWGRVEEDQGTLDFTYYDEIYCAAKEAGVRMDWHVTGIPAWAAPFGVCADPCVRPPQDEHLPALRRFAEAAAIRYPDAAAFEAWNEPNLKAYWKDDPDPEAYQPVLEAIYAGVKDGNPDAPVLGGALSNNPNDEPDGDLSLRTYLGGMLELGAADHMDGLSLHAYPVTGVGEEGDQFNAALRVSRELLPDGVRIWVTEVGATTAAGAFVPAVSPEQQAADMARVYDELAASDDVDAVIYHTLVDPEGEVPGGTGFGFFSAPDEDGNVVAKPVACAVLERASSSRAREHEPRGSAICPPGS
ncbi:MAG TPA: cellulase family glycosylhydrolase [Solirubrobacterales bacterium]